MATFSWSGSIDKPNANVIRMPSTSTRLPSEWFVNGAAAYMRALPPGTRGYPVILRNLNQFQLHFESRPLTTSGTTGLELLPAVESGLRMEFTHATAGTLTLDGTGSDTDEPYEWTPSNSAAMLAWGQSVAHGENVNITFTYPVNAAATGAPSISNTSPNVGDTIQANIGTIADSDGLPSGSFPTGYSFQWLRDGTAIRGATSRRYTVVAADETARLSVTVSFTDRGGNAESLTSAQTDAVPENTPYYLGSTNIRKAYYVTTQIYKLYKGLTLIFDLSTAPTPTGPTHTFSIVAGGSGRTIGYNAPGGWGSVASGSSAVFTPPGGSERTIVMARNLDNNFILTFSVQNVPIAEFPDRVVATFGDTSITFNKADSVRNISSGTRMDLIGQGSFTVGDVFTNGRTIRLELYYE